MNEEDITHILSSIAVDIFGTKSVYGGKINEPNNHRNNLADKLTSLGLSEIDAKSFALPIKKYISVYFSDISRLSGQETKRSRFSLAKGLKELLYQELKQNFMDLQY